MDARTEVKNNHQHTHKNADVPITVNKSHRRTKLKEQKVYKEVIHGLEKKEDKEEVQMNGTNVGSSCHRKQTI